MTQPETKAHTPLPWSCDNGVIAWWGGDQPGCMVRKQDGDTGHALANCLAQYASHEQATANAALIVRAVNSHAELLEALEQCPLPSTMGNVETHYQRFYDWYQNYAVPAIRKAGGLA